MGKKGGSIDKFGWTTAILLDKQSPVTLLDDDAGTKVVWDR